MSSTSKARRRWGAAAVVPAVALMTAGVASAGASVTATAAPATGSQGASAVDYINYVAPRAEKASVKDVKLTKDAKRNKAVVDAIERATQVDAKHAGGNPVAARQLARLEAKAIKGKTSPKHIKSQYKNAKTTQTAKLLTILVDFNEAAGDDFTGVQVPEFWGATTCKPGSVQNGPLHNNIPDPATQSPKDNNSMWVPDFSSAHYNAMLYTKTGLTQRVRTDLTGPDGKPGFDLSGYTMKNMYEEMSKGAYTVTGAATPWVTVPHSEAYYGASTCSKNADGEWEAGAVQDMQGHPDNPLGAGQLPIDAVAALAAAQPSFPWADYDVEDQGDVDGDNNFNEPDGVIDHVVLVHAGEDKSGGGGAESTYSIWAHSSAVPGGAPVPGTNLRLSNYIVQPEDSGVGVFAHEYGHDLGLPDLYDTSGAGDSDVDFWDLMSSGSHSGPIFQSIPTHMGIWDKWVLGWADPVIMEAGSKARDVIVGQTSRTPKGTADGVKINLPNKVIALADPHSGSAMWYAGADQNWADVTLSRSVAVPAGGTDAKFWMWNNYVIEQDWDFGFVEVSTDGGTTWTEKKVFDEAGTEVSTPDGYADPNGNLAGFGDKKYGLTGDSGGWQHEYVDLGAYAGTTVQVRLRQATDAGFLERGWFADDFSLTAGGATVWSDDVEGADDNGWTLATGTWTNTSGAGWHKDSGTQVKAQYYLVEWRNYDGFDKGLQYAYDTTYSSSGTPATDGAWKVEKIKYNAPGALVWYRDTAFGNVNWSATNAQTSLPSLGSKGGLLIVDSHFDPLRRSGANAALDPSTLKNLPSRPQSSNAAFGLEPTKAFKECQAKNDGNFTEVCNTFAPQAPVSTFTDAKTWYPGLELRATGLYFRDIDASVVVPSKGNAQYTTRIVDADGNLLTDLFGEDIGIGILGTGNPADAGVAYNTKVQVKSVKSGNTAAQIRITPPTP